jgi:hypothetical protein
MKKTIVGIIIFLLQIGLAIFYNGTIDLLIIAALSVLVFIYILYNYFNKKYDSCEI